MNIDIKRINPFIAWDFVRLNDRSIGYIRLRAGLKYPDLQYYFLAGAISYDGSSAVEGHGFQVHLGANKPDTGGD